MSRREVVYIEECVDGKIELVKVEFFISDKPSTERGE